MPKKQIEIDKDPVKNEDLIPIPPGQPISEEFAEELAEEAERGYADIDKWEPVSVSRLSPGSSRTSSRVGA